MTAEEKRISEEYRDAFLKLRRSVARKLNNTHFLELKAVFSELYEDIATRAVEGDVVAQDFLAYWFKRGQKDCLEVNLEMSMKWQILAAANGNLFSINKLGLFLSYAYDTIIFQDDFTTVIRDKNGLSSENYEMVLGKLVCEAIVDEMNLDMLSLTKENFMSIPENDVSYRIFDRAKFRAIEKVLEYLRK